jgi:hypothetical protein
MVVSRHRWFVAQQTNKQYKNKERGGDLAERPPTPTAGRGDRINKWMNFFKKNK